MAITFVNAGAGTTSSGAIAIALPASIQTDDILLLWVETENQAVTVSNQNGGTWTEVTSTSPQGTGTAGGPGATRLTLFWSRYNGTQGNPTISDSGDHQRGVILAYRGCVTSGDPWDVKAGDVLASASTTVTIPGATTTTDGCMAVFGVANTTDTNTSQTSSFTNANLTSVAHRTTGNSTTGNGGGASVGDGIKTTAGAIGNTTTTLLTSSVQGRIMIALKPAAGGTTVTPGLGAPVFAGLAPTILLAINVAAGLGQPVFTGLAPTVSSTSPTLVLPGTGAPVFSGQAPTILITVRIPTGLGAPVFTGFAPSVVASISASPGTGQVVFTGIAPSAVLSDNKRALPGLGQPTFTGFAPTALVGAGQAGLATPGRGQVTFSGFAPLVKQPLRRAEALHFLMVVLPSTQGGVVAISRLHGVSIMDNLTTADTTHDTSSTALNTSSAPMVG